MAQSPPLPTDPYAAYVPCGAEPWDVRRVNHLLRRAAFGPSVERVDAMLKLSPAQAVDSLLDFDPAQDPFNEVLDKLEGFFSFDRMEDVQNWCYYRMLNSPRPAQERMTLFWHNRFATSAAKVTNGRFMHGQMETFRQLGLGSFRDLLIAVGRDPAMLIWLDGQTNHKGHPNENYGREVMELFTLGVGNYTEKDVQELARAFTGWTIEQGKSVFYKAKWDDGEKHIFGKTGKFDSESAVDLLLAHPAAPKFLATKMLREFLHPQPSDEQIAYFAGRLLANQWQIKPVMKELLTSRLFFSDWAYRSRIKGPVELVVGGMVAMGGKASSDFARLSCKKMGQDVLFPPNVKGWDGNETWINANTVLLRFNFGMSVASQRRGEFARRPDLEGWLAQHDLKTPDDVIGHYARLLVDGSMPSDTRAKLLEFMNSGPHGETKPFVFNHQTFNTKVRGILHLMMSMPEYQLA